METDLSYPDTVEPADQSSESDGGTQSPTATGRGRHVVLLAMGAVAALALLALAVGFGSWTWYTRTPQYSVTQLQSAARDRDRLTLARYLDTRAMAEDLADAGALRIESATPEPLEGVVGSLGALARPLVVKAIDERLTDSLMGRVSDQESDQWSRLGSASASVESAGATATVTFTDDLARVPLVFVMRRQGDHWRAVSLGNADTVVADFWEQ